MAATAEPRWSNPPPSASTMPKLSRLGRWGRWLFKGGGPVGRAATALFDASPTAMPWFAEMPQDEFERALFAKARELEAQGVDQGEILEWFRKEGRAHAKTRAEAEKKKQTKAITATETVRVTGKSNKKELCEAACECLKDRGGHATYQACVAEKLRKNHYNPDSGKHPAGGPRRPKSTTADGPRPEVSYKKGSDGKYAPVESRSDPGMPSTAPVVPDAPRPDVSWWQDGALSELWEMKFPRKDGGIDGKTAAQEQGSYKDIAKDQSRPGRKAVKLREINVAEDCDCGGRQEGDA